MTEHAFPKMRLTDILALKSAEAEEDYDEYTVEDVLPYKLEDIAEDRDGQYTHLRISMQTRGQTVPVNICNGVLGDGHHRVAIAYELGWETLYYCGDSREGMWTDLEYDNHV
jgi:hypothetical protein